MKRLGCGALCFCWLSGIPFLLIVGVGRRMSAPYLPTHPLATSYGHTTDLILTTALILNGVIPIVGVLLARRLGDAFWQRHFGWALLVMALMYHAMTCPRRE